MTTQQAWDALQAIDGLVGMGASRRGRANRWTAFLVHLQSDGFRCVHKTTVYQRSKETAFLALYAEYERQHAEDPS